MDSRTKKTNNKRFVYDSYRRLIMMFADVVKGFSKDNFENILEEYKKEKGKSADIILLENHGVFVAGNTVEELGEKLGFVTSKIRNEIISKKSSIKVATS